jgi:SNF2 family DNA or RNA helicase
MSLKSLGLELGYRGGDLGRRVIQPCMSCSVSVDGVSAYFSLAGLRSVAPGLDALHKAGGTFRVVMSLQDAKGSEFVQVLRTATELKMQVEEVAKKIEAYALSVTESLERNRLATLGWMMKQGLLKIKVAAVKAADGNESSWAIFHEKAFIFRDAEGQGVAADGSMNFTENGMEWNSENLKIFNTWDSPQYFDLTVGYFETVWNDRDPRLIVRDIDKDIESRLAEVLISIAPPAVEDPTMKIVELLRRSPEFYRFNSSNVTLFPHQERALCEAMSRTPVRVMFSDDVGLGKTIEAGASLRYGIKHLGWKKLILLVPAGLATQWMYELHEKIGVTAKRLDRESGQFVDKDGLPVGSVDSPWGDGVFVVSAHLVSRSDRFREMFRREVNSAQCLLLDEAHAARRRYDGPNQITETLLYQVLASVAHKVPNLILLTATPMQSHQLELISLLSQLGIPMQWRDESFFAEYHDLLRRPDFTAEDANILVAGLRATKLLNPKTQRFEPYSLYQNPSVFKQALIMSAITPLLVIRNTRDALKKVGYKFPDRVIEPSQITMTAPAQSVYNAIESYISRYFGQTEEIIYGGENAIGFLYTTYFQRIVSSFNSAFHTLRKRRDKLQGWLDSDFRNIHPDEPDDEDDDDAPGFSGRVLSDNDRIQAGIKCRQELMVLKPIIEGLAALSGDNSRLDPKLARLSEIIDGLLQGQDAFLIFSRYTDTTSAVVQLLTPLFVRHSVGYAYYSGSDCWIVRDGRKVPANKSDVVDSLRRGAVRAVICTDAASEGLNLQTARHLVNVDVPWTPSRLEQRFGRIDRLGQKADKVTFYNLWYPGSIEERMYGAIVSRGADIGYSVGVMSDTVGRAIRNQLATRNAAHSIDFETSLEEVKNLQDNMNVDSIESTYAGRLSPDSLAAQFRSELLHVGAMAPGYRFESGALFSEDGAQYVSSLSEQGGDVINVFSKPLELIHAAAFQGSSAELLLAYMGETPICLICREAGRNFVLSPVDTVKCLRAVASGTAFVPSSAVDFIGESIDQPTLEGILKERFPGRVDRTALNFQQVLGLPVETPSTPAWQPTLLRIGHVRSV